MKRIFLLIIYILFTFSLLQGCSKVYLVTEKDPAFNPSISDYRFFIFTPDLATISDKKRIAILEQEMKEKGFRITTQLFVNDIVVLLNTGSHLYQSSGTMFLPMQSRTSGHIGNTNYRGTTSYLQPMPYTTSSFNYQISIDMFQCSGINDFNHVWSGYLDVKARDFDKAPNFYLSKVLDNFGQDREVHEYWTPPSSKRK